VAVTPATRSFTPVSSHLFAAIKHTFAKVLADADQARCQAGNKPHQNPGFQAFDGRAPLFRGLARYLLLPH
jgi:hypothetical protein